MISLSTKKKKNTFPLYVFTDNLDEEKVKKKQEKKKHPAMMISIMHHQDQKGKND